MPWYGAPELLERAVRSVLAQTYTDLRLVVMGDGAEPPLAVRDPRLVVVTLSTNRGPYFAHQALLLASDDEWFAVHDADDWSSSTHITKLMATGHDAAVPGSLCFHRAGAPRAGRGDGGIQEGRRIGWHTGIFRTERLRSIGGYEADCRLSQDTHMLRILERTGRLTRRRGDPTYHRWKRPGSLTTAKTTGLKSQARFDARQQNRNRLAVCLQLRRPEAIREYRESLLKPGLRAALAEETERLREALS